MTETDIGLLAPGRLIINQKTHKATRREAGRLYDLSRLEIVPEPVAVSCLRIIPARANYKGRGKADKPICWSSDGVRPSFGVRLPFNPTCAGCGAARWSRNQNAVCRDDWQMLLLLRDTKLIRWFAPGSSMTATLRALQRRVSEDSYISENKGNGARCLHHYAFTISPVKVKAGKHGFWSITIDGWRYVDSAVDRAELDHQAELYKSVTLESISITTEETDIEAGIALDTSGITI